MRGNEKTLVNNILEIHVTNLQTRFKISSSSIISTVKHILKYNKVSNARLNFVFVTGRKMRVLNSRYKDHHYTTDVLAFDLRSEKEKGLRGEIIISTDEAFKNARIYKTSVEHELNLYMAHGILHLLGYDDHGFQDIKKIRDMEQKIIESL
ncbi:MAG: rRNA maturation RNase YbeY [Candidatus Omnitrophica bacterium]|nr:rRNA maturation RNase YbeY [Candidatus Omnitrophota bacterium]